MKEKLRKGIIEKRRKQTKEENRKKSKEIKDKLFNLKEYKEAKAILFYISYNGEVFTHDIIKEALKEKLVVVPISKKDRSLILSELKKWGDLEVGSYRILEPKKDAVKKVSIDKIDLIIVPSIALDEKGNRLGHGKGYYDRLLKNINVPIVALVFEFQMIKSVPSKKQDIPVNMIITEKRIINCKNFKLQFL